MIRTLWSKLDSARVRAKRLAVARSWRDYYRSVVTTTTADDASDAPRCVLAKLDAMDRLSFWQAKVEELSV